MACPECEKPTEATGPGGKYRLCPACGWDGSPAPYSAWVCADCGSDDIQTMTWVNVNTSEVHEQCHSWNWKEASYCCSCVGGALFVSREEYEKKPSGEGVKGD